MHAAFAKTALTTAGVYIAAAFSEIAGCFAFWAWLRLGKSIWWVVPRWLFGMDIGSRWISICSGVILSKRS